MKGRVDHDVAQEACRQVWGARELFLRWGFGPEAVEVCTGYPVGEGFERVPLEERPMHAFVRLRDPRLEGGSFQIGCGPIGIAKEEWGKLMLAHLNTIAAGIFKETELQKQYEQTNAWIGRDEIAAELRSKGIQLVSAPSV